MKICFKMIKSIPSFLLIVITFFVISGCTESDDILIDENKDPVVEEFDSITYFSPYEIKQSFAYNVDNWRFKPQSSFKGNSVWREVVYPVDEPWQFTIDEYIVKYINGRGEPEHYLFKNSEFIGYISEPDSLANVYYRDLNDNKHLLYDFKIVLSESVGLYSLPENKKQGFYIPYEDMRIPRDMNFFVMGFNISNPYSINNCQDTIICNTGSKSGILSVIEENPMPGMCRDLMFVYAVNSFTLFINDTSPASPFLPEDFWKEYNLNDIKLN